MHLCIKSTHYGLSLDIFILKLIKTRTHTSRDIPAIFHDATFHGGCYQFTKVFKVANHIKDA